MLLESNQLRSTVDASPSDFRSHSSRRTSYIDSIRSKYNGSLERCFGFTACIAMIRCTCTTLCKVVYHDDERKQRQKLDA